MQNKILIVGSGFTGATIARSLAESGYSVDVIDQREHVGGNCYTYEDKITGVEVHKYGPHIFHTDNDQVWDFVNRFCEMKPYKLQVKATIEKGVFTLPINLHTINQFFDSTFTPAEAKNFIQSLSSSNGHVRSFEEQALKFIGEDLYHAFFEGYPIKQWGVHPRELPSSILKRLPVRFNYDDNYFFHKHQGIPLNGYTDIFNRMLHHDKISLLLNTKYDSNMREDYSHVFYTGTIDGWFNYSIGRLAYRSLKFEEIYGEGDIQGCAVMSYPETNVKFTRVAEHKYFTPWKNFQKSIAFKEFSFSCGVNDVPYYPVRLVQDTQLLKDYVDMAMVQNNISFLGRLGTYRYLDMDVTIKEALSAVRTFLDCRNNNKQVPVFFNNPLE